MSTAAAGEQRPHDEVLADAVRVLTEAARLTWSHTDSDGNVVITGRSDWAEFVTYALAGAAANVGSIEGALAGRSGSWEADGVRSLLTSTVGHDEASLLEHRTEPLVVEVFVDELLADRFGGWAAYDQANAEVGDRHDAASARDDETAMDAATDLEERLEKQRQQEWADYGQALKAAIQQAGAELTGLRQPVVVNVDATTYRHNRDRPKHDYCSPAHVLLEAAIAATPLPHADRAPLGRLEAAS